MTLYTIHSLGLAKRLIAGGCNLVKVVPNKLKADRLIYLFEHNILLIDLITKYTKEFNNTKL